MGPQGPAGTGTGDMLASTYDPQGKAQDVFAYVDSALDGKISGIPIVEINSTDSVAYMGTIEGLTTIPYGTTIVAIPKAGSMSTAATLNINNTGAVDMVLRAPKSTGEPYSPSSATWITYGVPILMTYAYYPEQLTPLWFVEMQAVTPQDLGVYTIAQTNAAIEAAIGGAIGGSY